MYIGHGVDKHLFVVNFKHIIRMNLHRGYKLLKIYCWPLKSIGFAYSTSPGFAIIKSPGRASKKLWTYA